MATEAIEKSLAMDCNTVLGNVLETLPLSPVSLALRFDYLGRELPNLTCSREIVAYLDFCEANQTSLSQTDLIWCQQPAIFLPLAGNLGFGTSSRVAREISPIIRRSVLAPQRSGRISLSLRGENLTQQVQSFRKDWLNGLTEADYLVTLGQFHFVTFPGDSSRDPQTSVSLNILPLEQSATNIRLTTGRKETNQGDEVVRWFRDFSPSVL